MCNLLVIEYNMELSSAKEKKEIKNKNKNKTQRRRGNRKQFSHVNDVKEFKSQNFKTEYVYFFPSAIKVLF